MCDKRKKLERSGKPKKERHSDSNRRRKRDREKSKSASPNKRQKRIVKKKLEFESWKRRLPKNALKRKKQLLKQRKKGLSLNKLS